MRRLFYQTKLYDYSTIKEAKNHIKEMEEKNWKAKRQQDDNYIYENGQADYPYSVEYSK